MELDRYLELEAKIERLKQSLDALASYAVAEYANRVPGTFVLEVQYVGGPRFSTFTHVAGCYSSFEKAQEASGRFKPETMENHTPSANRIVHALTSQLEFDVLRRLDRDPRGH